MAKKRKVDQDITPNNSTLKDDVFAYLKTVYTIEVGQYDGEYTAWPQGSEEEQWNPGKNFGLIQEFESLRKPEDVFLTINGIEACAEAGFQTYGDSSISLTRFPHFTEENFVKFTAFCIYNHLVSHLDYFIKHKFGDQRKIPFLMNEGSKWGDLLPPPTDKKGRKKTSGPTPGSLSRFIKFNSDGNGHSSACQGSHGLFVFNYYTS